MTLKTQTIQQRRCARPECAAFTLIELLVSLAILAMIAPVIYQALQVSTLAGEVSQRKALAARIAEEKLNETVMSGQTVGIQRGTEQAGPYSFQWTVKDEPWAQIASQTTSSTTSNAVNQGVVNQTLIHELSVDVSYSAQNRNFSVHLSTLINEANQ